MQGTNETIEQLQAERDRLALRNIAMRKGLNRIIKATNEWQANRLGGVHIQRKRWERCAEIALATLDEAEQCVHTDPPSALEGDGESKESAGG